MSGESPLTSVLTFVLSVPDVPVDSIATFPLPRSVALPFTSTRWPTSFERLSSVTSTYFWSPRASVSMYPPLGFVARQPVTVTSLPSFTSVLVFVFVSVVLVCAPRPTAQIAARQNAELMIFMEPPSELTCEGRAVQPHQGCRYQPCLRLSCVSLFSGGFLM